ncbi:MAG: tagatose-bisphosphate aldolase [Candidatus Parcubacteria bacterium]|jgi:tagatose-1,6-bisphosphate aldolase
MSIDIFKQNKSLLMLAIDHRGSFQKILSPDNPNAVSAEDVISTKKKIIDALLPEFSGILIDPLYGLKAYPGKQKPFLLSIEKTGYEAQNEGRITELEYTVEELKGMGASGIKLLIYFNPTNQTAQQQLDTAKTVLEESHKHDLPLFLEIVTYDEGSAGKADCIVKSVQMFLDHDIKADVFKLDYPENEQACRQITQMLGSIPWILLTRGGTYEVFKQNLQTAIANGAIGFLAGRSLWQEIGEHKNDADTYLQNTVLPRFKEICAVAKGA